MKKKSTDTVKYFCSECNAELKQHIFMVSDMDIDPDFDGDKFFVEPCHNCKVINNKIKEEYELISSMLLSKMKLNDDNIIREFTTICENYDTILKFLAYEIDVKLDKQVATFQDNIDILKKRLELLNIINPIINKILPEYTEVPIEYKILLLKERINATIKTSKVYNFDEIKINEIADSLSKGYKINMIKLIRTYLDVGLKDAKDIVESKISQAEFEMKYPFDEAKKIIMERF
jgi:ribosomal protein L7/L12